jgi:hypothetical protein
MFRVETIINSGCMIGYLRAWKLDGHGSSLILNAGIRLKNVLANVNLVAAELKHRSQMDQLLFLEVAGINDRFVGVNEGASPRLAGGLSPCMVPAVSDFGGAPWSRRQATFKENVQVTTCRTQ